jgi:hypothetical protein
VRKFRKKYIDNLYVDLGLHVLVTMAIGMYFYLAANSFLLFLVCVLGGVFIDLDHIYDCAKYHGRGFTLKDFFAGNYYIEGCKLYIPAHSWELVTLLCAVGCLSGQLWLFALPASMAGHLMVDHLVHWKRPYQYFLAFRWKCGFDAGVLDPTFALEREEYLRERREHYNYY